MKATKSEVQEGFKPFNITLTIESEEEARALYAIFNHTNNCDLIKSYSDLDRVRNAIGTKYKVDSGLIANGITYEEFYK